MPLTVFTFTHASIILGNLGHENLHLDQEQGQQKVMNMIMEKRLRTLYDKSVCLLVVSSSGIELQIYCEYPKTDSIWYKDK